MDNNATAPLTAEAVNEESVIEQELQMPDTATEFIAFIKTLVETENPERSKVESVKAAFYKHQKQEIELAKKLFVEAGNAVEDFDMEPYNALETEFKSHLNLWREKRAEQLAQAAKEKQDNFVKKTTIIETIHELNENTEDIHKSLNEVRRLQQEWKETGEVPQEQVNVLWKKYQAEIERFYDQLRLYNEFRDYDSKKNLELQTALCEQAEQLVGENDVVVAFRKLQELHEQWREIGPVAKEIREEVWQRFKTASTEINKKYQQFFERLKENETENLNQKTALCEALEAIELDKLTSMKLWEKKTQEIIEIQEKWKSIGFAPKKSNQKIYERYRTACDRFFEAKSAFYKDAKNVMMANLEKKKALCEQAEALKDSTDWVATSNVLVQLQKDWKTIGAVPHKNSDAIWKRFVAACDYFFEQKQKNSSSKKSEEQTNLDAKKALIEEVKAYEGEPENGMDLIREFNARWNAIGHVPFREKDKVYEAWREATQQLMSRLNLSRDSRRPNRGSSDSRRPASGGKAQDERSRLMRQYETVCNEIKTYENNMGFFSLSSKKGGNPLLEEMNRNVEKLKQERDKLVLKIQEIDKREEEEPQA